MGPSLLRSRAMIAPLAPLAPFDLASALDHLIQKGTLRLRSGYRKSELIDAFSTLPNIPDPPDAHTGALFTELRRVVSDNEVVGKLRVHTQGTGRGLKYLLFDTEPRTPSVPSGAAVVPPAGAIRILEGDNLQHLETMQSGHYRLIYIDPPFNTGIKQTRSRVSTVHDPKNGDRTGFKGKRYRTIVHSSKAFGDTFQDFLGFLAPRLEQAHRLLSPDGSLFLHLDYREIHYVKVLLDEIFGRESFINEIVWAYDYGARSKKKWSAKHDNILWYAKDPNRYVFNFDEMDRIPYMAPGLVGPEKAARGKTPTDVWWHTIVSPNGREKNGYPTQKPLGVLNRIVKVHSSPGDHLLDFFAGSGTLGEAGAALGRSVTLIDNNEQAISVMQKRLERFLASDKPI